MLHPISSTNFNTKLISIVIMILTSSPVDAFAVENKIGSITESLTSHLELNSKDRPAPNRKALPAIDDLLGSLEGYWDPNVSHQFTVTRHVFDTNAVKDSTLRQFHF